MFNLYTHTSLIIPVTTYSSNMIQHSVVPNAGSLTQNIIIVCRRNLSAVLEPLVCIKYYNSILPLQEKKKKKKSG